MIVFAYSEAEAFFHPKCIYSIFTLSRATFKHDLIPAIKECDSTENAGWMHILFKALCQGLF